MLEISSLLLIILATLFVVSPALAQNGEAELRMVHLSPDAPEVTVKVDGKQIKALSNVAYKDATSYLKLPAGPHRVTVYAASNLSKPILEENISPQANKKYTIVGVGLLSKGNFSMRLFQDDTRPPKSGKAKVRVIHAIPDVGPATVSVAKGPKLFALPGLGDASNYAEVDPGTYTFNVATPGSKKPAFSIPNVRLKKGQTYTVFAIGQVAKKTVGALITDDTKDGKVVYLKGGGQAIKDHSNLAETSGAVGAPAAMAPPSNATSNNATPADETPTSSPQPSVRQPSAQQQPTTQPPAAQQPAAQPPSGGSRQASGYSPDTATVPQPTKTTPEPATTQPAATQSATAQPATTQPAATQPAATQSAAAQPAATEPVAEVSQPAPTAAPVEAPSVTQAQTPAVADVSGYVAPAPVAVPVTTNVPAPVPDYSYTSGTVSGTVYGSVQEVVPPVSYLQPAVPANVPSSAQVAVVINDAVNAAANATATANATASTSINIGSQATVNTYVSQASTQVGATAVISQSVPSLSSPSLSSPSTAGGVSLPESPAQGASSGPPASVPVNVPVTATVNNQSAVLSSVPRRRFVSVRRLGLSEQQ